MTMILITWIIFASCVCVVVAGPRACDTGRDLAGREGALGQTALFPWLGVLRVQINQEGSIKVALTGILLVKEGYAIAIADDVARIPKRMFREDSRAMFMPRDNATWFCKLRDYMTHPEYEYSTVNTVALLELDPGDDHFPITPICWPPFAFNTSDDLYVLGITDDNVLLEKSIYSMQHFEQNLCRQFYSRAGLRVNKLSPTHYQCAIAKSEQDSCVWDNGMVLASNSSELWTLVGLGVRGPGCSAPARFLQLAAFFPWIDSTISAQQADNGHRKSGAFADGVLISRANGEEELNLTPDLEIPQSWYPFDTESVQDQYFAIERIDKAAILLKTIQVPGEYGNCTAPENVLIFRDETRIVAARGRAVYKISLYDLNYLNCTCVKIWLEATRQETASIYYNTTLNNAEGTAFHPVGDTPKEVLKEIPIKVVHPMKPEDSEDSEPGPHLKPKFLEDIYSKGKQQAYVVYLTFSFEGEGILKWEALGPIKPPPKDTDKDTDTDTVMIK